MAKKTSFALKQLVPEENPKTGTKYIVRKPTKGLKVAEKLRMIDSRNFPASSIRQNKDKSVRGKSKQIPTTVRPKLYSFPTKSIRGSRME